MAATNLTACHILEVLWESSNPQSGLGNLQHTPWLVLSCDPSSLTAHCRHPPTHTHTYPPTGEPAAPLLSTHVYTWDSSPIWSSGIFKSSHTLSSHPLKDREAKALTPGSVDGSPGSSRPHTEASPPHLPGYSFSGSDVSNSCSQGEHLTSTCSWGPRAGRTRAYGARATEIDAQEGSPNRGPWGWELQAPPLSSITGSP